MSETYLRGKYKGQLKLPAIRRLVRAHNKASKIVITKLNYEQTLEKLRKEGYTIDHDKKKLISNKVIDLPPKLKRQKKKVMSNLASEIKKKKDTPKDNPFDNPKINKLWDDAVAIRKQEINFLNNAFSKPINKNLPNPFESKTLDKKWEKATKFNEFLKKNWYEGITKEEIEDLEEEYFNII